MELKSIADLSVRAGLHGKKSRLSVSEPREEPAAEAMHESAWINKKQRLKVETANIESLLKRC